MLITYRVKKFKIEKIRIQAPKFLNSWNMGKVQRLNVCGHENEEYIQ